MLELSVEISVEKIFKCMPNTPPKDLSLAVLDY